MTASGGKLIAECRKQFSGSLPLMPAMRPVHVFKHFMLRWKWYYTSRIRIALQSTNIALPMGKLHRLNRKIALDKYQSHL